MSLNITCEVAGDVRIVSICPHTGNETNEKLYKNTWTDYGLEGLRSSASKQSVFPGYVAVGSGRWPKPHNALKKLHTFVGSYPLNFGGLTREFDVEITEDSLTAYRTSAVDIPKRGEPWTLNEIGLASEGSHLYYSLYTYIALVNDDGIPEGYNVDADEIVRIFYTLRFTYPLTLEPIVLPAVEKGLPETTLEFSLHLPPINNNGYYPILRGGPGLRSSSYDSHLSRYLDASIDVNTSRKHTYDLGEIVYGVDDLNDVEFHFITFYNQEGMPHKWKITPPISKNNVQEFRISSEWSWKNKEED